MQCKRQNHYTGPKKTKELDDEAGVSYLNSSKSQFHYIPSPFHPRVEGRGKRRKRREIGNKVHGRQSSELSICLSPGRLMAMRLLNGRNIRTGVGGGTF
ncbi:hypothetical protein NPIL_521971 [Nephila pilipes]|uniref:Uncharacterized protein n=1 Tax=Nephila pilipes TaxID=299642 RepID=A0A8X6TA40_NEPPI|nr:hypothetical protein NPIL_521971 [Nephila pilipes]